MSNRSEIMAKRHRMKFVSDRLTMPLFILGRNRIMEHGLNNMKRYLNKQRNFYTKSCNEENTTENVTQRHMKDSAGFYKKTPIVHSCPHTRSAPYSRELTQPKAWQLAPNRYAVPLPIGASRKGMSGAYWRKKKKVTVLSISKKKKASLKPKPKPQWRLYDIPRDVDRLRNKCYQYRGIFASDPRERRPTTRGMINNTMTCYRDPDEPSPADYYSHLHELNYKKEKKIVKKRANPYLFSRNSAVPDKVNSLTPRHTSFTPGPGRYETSIVHTCPCPVSRTYVPGIQWLIDREKRRKFRRMEFTKIKARDYCFQEFRHVTGQGHRHLFKNIPKRDPKLKPSMAGKPEKLVHLYPDAKYIALINTPKHTPLPYRREPVLELPKRIRYNCIVVRHFHRRHLNNIAFNSGQERFPDIETPPIFTTSALKRAIARLPPERRLNDYPVMNRSPEEITSKLTSTPLHQQCNYDIAHRKRLFKFLPLPKPKILVTIDDVRGSPLEASSHAMFCKKVDDKKYFKTADTSSKRQNEMKNDDD